jgi:LysM domain
MTTIYTISLRTGSTGQLRRPVQDPCYRRPARSCPPGPARPAGAPTCYRGTGVPMSVVSHRRRPVRLTTTVGLALLAGIITLWLGLIAHLGQLANGETTAPAAHVPDRLAVVRVEAGESLQDVAARVAPDAPVRQVAQRIRELNDLKSPTLVAGQTLIAPVG